MRLTRARYITICQQFLVTAVVVAVGLSAAGVMTLQIVTPEAGGPGGAGTHAVGPATEAGEGFVSAAPVTPHVREVKVAPLTKADRAAAGQPVEGKKVAAVSTPTKVKGYATVGVTWKPGTRLAEDQITVQVRTRTDGRWTGWTTAAYHDEHGPDAGTAEAEKIRPGTDAVVIGDVDQVQMRATTVDGTAPQDLELAVVDPGEAKVHQAAPAIDTAKIPASDVELTSAPIEATGSDTTSTAAGGTDGDAVSLAAMKIAPKPQIFSRAQWGANESLRDKSSLRYGTVKAGFIHHTVNANNYTPEQVPALLRGIYAYHTQSRGWSDIGYNYLVDRFGRIWEGRYGGVDRAVVGAHTLGYNEYAFAMSAIGNFDVAQPPQAVLDAYAKLFAWKLSLYDIRADAPKVWVKDRYLHAINGHRDVGQTACPGRYLYAKIPSIRVAAQNIQNTGIVPTTPTDPVNLVPLAAPAGVPLPTDKPAAAVSQPAISFPARRNVVGSVWPDLVAKSADGTITLITTGGMLGYAAPVVSTGPWRGMSLILAAGDLTGDGKGDVIARNANNRYTRVYRSDGRGHISSKPWSGTGTWAFKDANLLVAAGDVNKDGKADVLSRDRRTGALMLHRGKGNGTFATATVFRKTWNYSYTAAADFNRDGKLDLVGVRSDNAVVYFPGRGGTTATTSLGKAYVLLTSPRRITGLIAAGDSTGDGNPDLGVKTDDALFSLYAGNGKGRLGQKFGPFTATSGLGLLSGASMRGTAATDIVARDTAGRLQVLTNNGLWNINSRIRSNLIVPGATQVLSVGDWDRDGRADVITREQSGNRLVLRPGLGNGKFARGRSLGNGWAGVTRLAAVGDVTGDGFPDLLGRIGSGPVLIFPGAGKAAFKLPMIAPASLRTFNQIGGAAWSPLGSRFVSEDGTFVPLAGSDLGTALRAANGQTVTSYDTYVGVGDADGDGVADLLAREKGTGTLWLLPGKTSGGFKPRVWVANGNAGYQLIG